MKGLNVSGMWRPTPAVHAEEGVTSLWLAAQYRGLAAWRLIRRRVVLTHRQTDGRAVDATSTPDARSAAPRPSLCRHRTQWRHRWMPNHCCGERKKRNGEKDGRAAMDANLARSRAGSVSSPFRDEPLKMCRIRGYLGTKVLMKSWFQFISSIRYPMTTQRIFPSSFRVEASEMLQKYLMLLKDLRKKGMCEILCQVGWREEKKIPFCFSTH